MDEPRPAVYADATALIALARFNRLDLLTLLPGPIRVTAVVRAEVASDPALPGTGALLQARAAGLVDVVEEGDPAAFPQLDPGEATTVGAAADAAAAVLLDERKARALIASDQRLLVAIPWATGVVGLVLLAKRRGYLPAVRPLLDDLLRRNFYMSPALYDDALRQAGER